MNYWAAIILLGVLFNFGCDNSSVEKLPVTKNLITEISVFPTPPVQQASQISDDIVYTHILESMVYGSDKESKDAFEPVTPAQHFTVIKETIAPKESDEIKSSTALPVDLINDFRAKNRSKTQLRNRYGAKISHDVIEQKETLDAFFKLIKRKRPELKAVIGLSRVGFNADQTKALVYVEYFNPEKQLIKRYCLIDWKQEEQTLRPETVSWF